MAIISFFSLGFLFFLLPLTVLVFAVVPQRYRSFVLVVSTFYFFATVSPLFLLVMCGSVLTDYLLSRFILPGGAGGRRSKLLLWLVAAKNILLVVTFSVGSQLLPGKIIAFGTAVYSFTSLGYLLDLYHDEADPITGVYDYFVFCCFFGKLPVGPIVSSRDFAPQLRTMRPSVTKMSEGCVWFCHGLAKKVLLADGVLALGNQLSAIPYQHKTVLGIWLLILCYLFSVYFSLSGYSDMARGLGSFFGLNLPENFHYPLQSDSITDFFSNFNISANRFVRKYVYRALGAEDNGAISTAVNIMLITMLMGVWYGISLNFLMWGAILGVVIVFETLMGDRLHRVPVPVRRLVTLCLLVVSFAVFCSGTLSQAWFYLHIMFGFGNVPLFDHQALYLLSSNLVLLLCCALFSTSFLSRRGRMLQHRWPLVASLFSLLSNAVIFVVSIAFLV
ncbi:MAG: MBOAT family O-acyltransferase [Angelakisella sp.]